MKKILIGLLFIVFLSFSAEAKQYGFQGLTDTGTYPAVANLALDGWPVLGDLGPPVAYPLTDGAFAYGHDNAGNYYTYIYDSSSAAAEDVPNVITPNDSTGNGRWLKLGLGLTEFLQFNPTTAIAHSEGLIYYDNVTKTLNVFNDEPDVTLNVGTEGHIRVFNDSGFDIDDGKVCYIGAPSGGAFTVDLAQADSAATSLGTIGFATHSIENGTYGWLTRWGAVHNQVTTGGTGGAAIFLSATSPGDYVETAPLSPNYRIPLGTLGEISGTVGTIDVNISIGSNTGDVIKIFNGAVLEDSDVSVTSNGTTEVTLSYEKTGSGDLSLFFNGIFSVFDSTPAATILLTAGSDVAPTMNYVYIPESTRALTVSTVDFPSVQHVPVATVLVQSPASALTDGVYKVHAWTDHLSTSFNQGHLSDLNSWVRNQNATYKKGVDPSVNITINAGAIDNVYPSNTSGEVLQLHLHSYPAIDTEIGDPVFVVNDPTTVNRRVTDFSVLDEDSTGATLRSNNTYYSIVMWGSVSQSDSDSKLWANLPEGSYISSLGAVNDANGYSDYTIPADFKGVGFLIARATFRYQTADTGTITLVDLQNLRGLFPSTTPGGGSGIMSNEFSDNLFRIYNVSDITKQLELDLSGITTGNVRGWIIPDFDINFGDLADKTKNETITGDWDFSGTIGIGNIVLSLSLPADGDFQGFGYTDKNAGETIAKWDHVYLYSATDEWMIADSDVVGEWPSWGIAATSGTDGNPLIVWYRGTGRNDAWNWTPKAPLYLSDVTGEMTETAPSTPGDCVQPVGVAITADEVDFNIDHIFNYLEVETP